MKIKNIRSLSFSLIDYFKSHRAGLHYKNLNYFLNKAAYHEILSFQKERIQELLKHAQTTTTFYQTQKDLDISDFPVVNKKIITDNKSAFLSNLYQPDKLFKVSTSGSTGTPFTVYQDNRKKNYHTADTIFFNELSGLNLGDRLYYFRVWDKLVKKSFLSFFAQNVLPIDASKLDCESLHFNFLEKLKREKQPVGLLAYSSTFEALSTCCHAYPKDAFKHKVKTIITMSETLPDGSRELLEQFFACNVVSRYSNMENGMLGLQIKSNANFYLLNEVSFFIEILKMDTDEPADEGDLGRIVVTDLYNFAQPIIRYDTGDIGSITFQTYKGKTRKFLKSVEGRKVDFITDTKGLLVSPHTITNTMWRYQFIKQFQFIQLGVVHYKLVLNTDESHQSKVEGLLTDLKEYIGRDAVIEVEYTDEIPLLNSGKRKKVMNLYNA